MRWPKPAKRFLTFSAILSRSRSPNFYWRQIGGFFQGVELPGHEFSFQLLQNFEIFKGYGREAVRAERRLVNFRSIAGLIEGQGKRKLLGLAAFQQGVHGLEARLPWVEACSLTDATLCLAGLYNAFLAKSPREKVHPQLFIAYGCLRLK